MTVLERTGLLLPGTPSVPEMVQLARRAEALGYESVWLAETRFTRDAIVAAAAVAGATSRVRIGTAVVNPFTRGAVLTAVTFASLDELSQGRAVIGIGPGSPGVLAQQGITWTQPLVRLREYVVVVRAVLSGEPVTYAGATVSVSGARLDFEPVRRSIPIYLGVTGPKALALAGEIADGVILNGLVSDDYTRQAVNLVRAGAVRAGRDPDAIEFTASLTVSADPDGGYARNRLRPLIAEYLARFPQLARATGLPDTLLDCVARVYAADPTAAADLIDDSVVSELACAGTPEECRVTIARRRAAGVQLPLLSVAAGDPSIAVDALAPNPEGFCN
jgi:5,10-methylenetetrahydromethanopterin reductase